MMHPTTRLLILAATISISSSALARTWTSADGTKSFKADLQSYVAETGLVSVRMSNGRVLKFKAETLSEADLDFLKAEARKSAPGVKVKELPDELPDPDGEEADMSKPVQVFILMGQSNMLGFGKINGPDKPGTLEYAAKKQTLYPYLVDDDGNWTERKDVRNVRVMGSGTGAMKVFNNEWMTIQGRAIGPEIGIGITLAIY